VSQADLLEATPTTKNMSRAYELRDRVTGRQKLLIESLYHRVVTGDVEKAAQINAEMAQTFPRNSIAYVNLSSDLDTLGQFERAADQAREALRLEPDNWFAMTLLMGEDIELNHPDEAKAIYDSARSHNIDGSSLSSNRYLVAFLENDKATMAEQLKLAMGKPGFEDVLLLQQSDTEAYHGRFVTAREFSQRAVDSAVRANMVETAARWRAEEPCGKP
jgi:tetratricopeptide (TPR) repeat protein